MDPGGSCLGVCYTGNQLFYSVNNTEQNSHLTRIGSIDFNFDIEQAVISGHSDGFPTLKSSLEEIKQEFECSAVKILAPATEECWTIVPRSVYEDASEREAHIQLLMRGSDRSEIQAIWQTVSNSDNRLLLLRDNSSMDGINNLLYNFRDKEIVSDYELGIDWQLHTGDTGAFLMIHCQKNYISVTSFILGKLRGCTYIDYDELSDLTYLWTLYAEKLSWMRGMHENTYVFGHYGKSVIDLLNAFWHDHGTIRIPDTLETMKVDAPEKTYGFRLESAFPAILMSLNKEKADNTLHENYNRQT